MFVHSILKPINIKNVLKIEHEMGTSDLSLVNVYFDPSSSTLAQKTVDLRFGMLIYIQNSSRPSTSGQTVHIRATVHSGDCPLGRLFFDTPGVDYSRPTKENLVKIESAHFDEIVEK